VSDSTANKITAVFHAGDLIFSFMAWAFGKLEIQHIVSGNNRKGTKWFRA
jgi:predicted phosphodiesterase